LNIRKTFPQGKKPQLLLPPELQSFEFEGHYWFIGYAAQQSLVSIDSEFSQRLMHLEGLNACNEY
jgi:hypothetical protein